MGNNKKITKNVMALIQISILIVSMIAFTQFVAAQTSSAPLSTGIIRKAVIKSNQSIQESEGGAKTTITGASLATWTPSVILTNIGKFSGKSLASIFGGLSTSIFSSGLAFTVYVWAITFVIVWARGGDFNESLFWANAAGASLGIGFITGSFSGGLFKGLGLSVTAATPIGWIIGGLTALYSFWRMTMRVDQRAIVFDCKTWQSQTGGDDCRECNNKEFPCTEYKCKSLGQACELVNEGDDARCIYKNPTDIASPEITPRIASLLSEDYTYDPIPATNGVEIKYNGGCLPSFESFTYGVELDKLGTCKIENRRTESFSDMQLSFGSGLWKVNHTQLMAFPGQANLEEEGIELPTGGNYEFYVRCESVNGYANVGEFLFRFCIDPLPDTSQPNMQGFNLLDRTPIRWLDETEAHETQVSIYVNEPLFSDINGCKWSHSDKDYANMEGNMTSCSDTISEFTTFNAQISYACSGTLTGLQNSQENKFYFRCKDTAGNVNTASKELTLIGSNPLIIDSVGPSGNIKGSSNLIKIALNARTSAGYEEGVADCYYSNTGNYNDYTKFENTRSYTHSNEIYLPEGNYTYYIQCFDMAGNIEVTTTEFGIETDFGAPSVVRAYYEGGNLNLITSESAECVYDTTSCNYLFDDGVGITSSDDITHSVEWNTNENLYIKCQDEYGNQPSQCSVILRAFEFF